MNAGAGANRNLQRRSTTGLDSDWPRPAASLDALARLEADQMFAGAGRAFSGAELLAGLASDWPRPAPSLMALARLEAAPVFPGAGASRDLRRRVV